MTTVFHARLYGRFIEVQNNLRRNKPFLEGSFGNRAMFIYSVQNPDIFSGIHFFWCHSFTMFKQSKSNISWLNRKIQHGDGESPIPKQ